MAQEQGALLAYDGEGEGMIRYELDSLFANNQGLQLGLDNCGQKK